MTDPVPHDSLVVFGDPADRFTPRWSSEEGGFAAWTEDAMGRNYRLRFSKNDVSNSEFYMEVMPAAWVGDATKPAALYAPALSAGAMNLRGWFAFQILADRIPGWVVAASDLGDTPSVFLGTGVTGGPGVWGNDQSIAKLQALRTYLLSSKIGARPGKLPYMAGSHGAAAMCNTLRLDPTVASCAAMAIPTVDVEDIRANNRNGYQASIETAYVNNAAWQAARPTHNPVEFAAQLSSIPFIIFYSSDDPICLPATVQAFAAAHGNTTLVNTGAHSHSTIGVDWQAMADFLVSHTV